MTVVRTAVLTSIGFVSLVSLPAMMYFGDLVQATLGIRPKRAATPETIVFSSCSAFRILSDTTSKVPLRCSQGMHIPRPLNSRQNCSHSFAWFAELPSNTVTVLPFLRGSTIARETSDMFEKNPQEPWFLTKKIMLAHLKQEEWRSLMGRRPDTYGGLTTCHVKAHRALLRSMDSWDQTLIVRIWTGSVMTRTKSVLIGKSRDRACSCGCELQTLKHALWECPFTETVGEQIEFWSLLPPAQSVSHPLPHPANNKELEAWKASCKRAVRVVKMLSRGLEQGARVERTPRDTKGHVIRLPDDSLYVFCGRWENPRPELAVCQAVWVCSGQGVGFGRDACVYGAWGCLKDGHVEDHLSET